MPETRLVIQQNKGDPIVQVTTYKKVEQAKGPYNRNASWEVAADGTIVHKNKRYYLDRCINVLWRVLIAVLAAYMVVIGSIYLIDCRIEKRVPLYLLVGGICLLPVSILALLMMRGDKALTGLWKLIATFVCSPLMLFILVWTIVGAVWTFSVIQTVDIHDPNSLKYCNPVLYVSSAISVIMTAILLCILIYSSVNYFRRGVNRGFIAFNNLGFLRSFIFGPIFQYLPLFHFDFSSSRNDELGPALDLAITDLSKYYNGTEIVIHYSAQIFPGLYMCDQSMAVIAQLSAQYYFSDVKTHEQTVFVFFVAGCVELMVFAADFARDANSMFVLSMGTQGTLNDEIRFPTVIRFVPYQAANIADCYFGILQYFMWFHSSLFTEMALPLYDEVARALITKFRWSRKFLNIAFNFCETTLVEDLKLAARSSRIMLLAVPMYRVRQILVAAQKLGFVNGDFVYIAAWPYEHAQYGNLSWQYGDADDQVARSAFGSLLVITPKITSTELRICDMYKVILPNSKKNPLVLATYLSFIATAKVIASAWTNGKNVKNATALVRDLRSPSYAQEPIMVLLKAALYSILRFDEGSLSLRDVYSYNPSNKEWEPTPGAVPKWPRPTNEPPPDEPYCGFMNEKPWCQQSRSSSPEISSVISILVLLLMSVISFTPLRIYRRNRKANSIDRWILDAADLIPTRNSGTSPRLSCSSRNSTQQVASENSSAYPYMYYI